MLEKMYLRGFNDKLLYFKILYRSNEMQFTNTFINNALSLPPVSTITSFDEMAAIKPRSFVVCDIDETLLWFPSEQKKTGISFFARPVATDLAGFYRLQQSIEDTDSKLIFLTSRYVHSRLFTLKNLNDIQVRSVPDIHFTNGTPKGDYLLRFLNRECQSCSEIVFIDDLLINLHNVYYTFPEKTVCYQFLIQ